jgi:FkbM family methyltransferase
LHKQNGNEVYEYAAADFEKDDVPFVVVEDSKSYDDTSLSAHSYSALSIRQDFADYKDHQVDRLSKRDIRVAVRKLDTILEQANPAVTAVDAVSIDVEGYELDVMRGFTPERFGTKVIVLENLFHKREYEEYMKTRGFELVAKRHYNYFFVSATSAPHQQPSFSPNERAM